MIFYNNIKLPVAFFVFGFLSFHIMCSAQETDSIYPSLNKSADNSSKIKALAAAANSLASSNPTEAVKLAKYIISLSISLNYTEGKAIGYDELGNAFERYSVYDSAFYYFFSGFHLFSQINNQEGKANTLINIGNTHEIMGNYDSAAYYAFRALSFVDSTGDPNLKAKNLRVVGNIMYKTDRHEEAVQYYLEALSLLEIHNDMPGLRGRVCENLALAYIKLSHYNTAGNYFAEASEIYNTTKDPRDLARLNLNMASLRELQGAYNEAISRTKLALEFYNKINHANGRGECLLTLSETYYKMRNYSDASVYAQQAIEAVRYRRDMDLEINAYRVLQKINFETGNYKKAYRYQAAASMLHDTILSEKKATLITELQNQFLNQTKENKIQLLNKNNEIKALTIKKQIAVRNSLIIGTVLIIVVSVLLINQYRISGKRKRSNERRRISSDLHDDIGSGLSKITLLTHVLKQHISDAQSITELEKISEAATDALEKMSEMVWSLNSKNDKLENLLSYIRKYGVEFFEPTTIVCRVYMPDEIPDKVISGGQRRNIFLTVKEALNNIIKHASATNVDISFSGFHNRSVITIHDNGKGINTDRINSFGNGLLNMKQRMHEAGGNFSIESSEGTTIRLEINLQHTPKG